MRQSNTCFYDFDKHFRQNYDCKMLYNLWIFEHSTENEINVTQISITIMQWMKRMKETTRETEKREIDIERMSSKNYDRHGFFEWCLGFEV